jgi:hypothetical protein
MQGVLAELLDGLVSPRPGGPWDVVDLAGSGPAAADPEALAAAVADARHQLDEAAARAVAVGGWTPADPLRLSKHRLLWLLKCPHRALLVADTLTGDPDDLVLGLVVDAAAKLLALGATRPVTVDDALGHLDAVGSTTAADHLAAMTDSAAAELREEAGERLAHLAEVWPELESGSWPRVEDPVRVRLAEGAVLLSGKLDILLGGPPTDRPAVVVEIKGGRWHDTVRNETQFYGLITALRDQVAPAAVVTLAAGAGETYREDARPALLEHAAASVAHALDVAAGITAGELAERRPGSHCSTCPARSTCPSAPDDSGQEVRGGVLPPALTPDPALPPGMAEAPGVVADLRVAPDTRALGAVGPGAASLPAEVAATSEQPAGPGVAGPGVAGHGPVGEIDR